MYGNDYSWVPAFFAGLTAVAAVGGLIISLVRPSRIQVRVLRVWLSIPVLMSIGLGIFAALYAENLEPYSPLLFVPMFSAILLPPWLAGAYALFAISRHVQGRIVRRQG